MNIYLVRHGEAEPERIDPERPLTSLGQEEVETVARMAAARDVRVSVIFHSGILRARQTADILARHLQSTSTVRQLSGLLPQDDPAIARAELEAARSPVMLVGHLPHLNRLAALLVCGDAEREIVDFAPATLACCLNDEGKWTIAWTLRP
jgi:phosphohistidine phosphatase